MLDRKINKASSFSPPCPHSTPSRPGHASWQQRFLPGQASPAARSGSRGVPELGSGRSAEPPSLPPTREWVWNLNCARLRQSPFSEPSRGGRWFVFFSSYFQDTNFSWNQPDPTC